MSEMPQENETPAGGMEETAPTGESPTRGPVGQQKLGDVWRATAKIPLEEFTGRKPSEGRMPGEEEMAPSEQSSKMPGE